MAKKRITLTRIANNSARKATLINRRAGLFKKTKELSVLSDVKSCAVVYSPGEAEPAFFPSYEVVRGMFEKFLSMSPVERSQKMVTHERYLTQRIASEIKRNDRAKKKNDMKEAQEDMNKIYEGSLDLGELDVERLKKLRVLVVDKLKDIEERERRPRQLPTPPPPVPPPPPPPQAEERERGLHQQGVAPPPPPLEEREGGPHHQAAAPLPPPPPPPPLEEREGGPHQQAMAPPPLPPPPPPHEMVGVEDLDSLVYPTWIQELMKDNWFAETMEPYQQDIPCGPSWVISDLEIASPEHHVVGNMNAGENDQE
ncbi:hypothetical protein Vadar_032475 [Vaccinium darrowii]|uniref:Uncharacterized protein n=1 Tax=Vaccinium darrowii TaxID=229202 RepID=A0ACB7YQZ7_9ERIC|nr:hypothetical protein Vadar_032475 [Vaccinium darrowii]